MSSELQLPEIPRPASCPGRPWHEGRRTTRGLVSGVVIFKSIPRSRGHNEIGVHAKIVRLKSNTSGILR